ncbi:MAG: hypothetical protein V9G08_11805 [Dermatophilaceae bacterium]
MTEPDAKVSSPAVIVIGNVAALLDDPTIHPPAAAHGHTEKLV